MSNILIYRKIDIFNNTDYINLHNTLEKKFGGECPNFGNKLWYQGLISEISTSENEITYYNQEMKQDEINEKFDMIIYPMANIFSKEFSVNLDKLSDFFEKIKIPVYVISCGAQADSYDDLNDLVKSIGSVSKRFISTIYKTGGQFALRGWFTAEFFKKLGFDDPAVVGCPSLYQLGRNLKITKKEVDLSHFKPSFNGKFDVIKDYLNRFDNSVFYDQDHFYDYLYNPNYYSGNSIKRDCLKFLKSSPYSLDIAKLIVNDRLKLIADMWDWQNSFYSENINFSFGSRIHGSVIALLSRIPAVVVGFDSRTREMAEFYNIPCVKSFNEVKPQDLYKFYQNVDFSNFNKNFAILYDNFEDFLIQNKIVKTMNTDNPYLNRDISGFTDPCEFVCQYSKQIAENIDSKKALNKIISAFVEGYRKIRR